MVAGVAGKIMSIPDNVGISIVMFHALYAISLSLTALRDQGSSDIVPTFRHTITMAIALNKQDLQRPQDHLIIVKAIVLIQLVSVMAHSHLPQAAMTRRG